MVFSTGSAVAAVKTASKALEFNWHALLLGSVTRMMCLAIQASFVVLVMAAIKPRIKTLTASRKAFRAHGYFYLAMLILLTGHLLQICIWGFALYLFDIVPNQHDAFTLAGSTYTTVGFVSLPMPWDWQLLLIIMATSGLFSFAWSTSNMFNLTRVIYPVEK